MLKTNEGDFEEHVWRHRGTAAHGDTAQLGKPRAEQTAADEAETVNFYPTGVHLPFKGEAGGSPQGSTRAAERQAVAR